MNIKTNFQEGQVLLLVLLAVSVLATMVLSVTSRSVSEVAVTTREEESLRAFSAAEAGVEEALITGTLSQVSSGAVPPIERSFQAGSSSLSNFVAEVSRYPQDLRAFNYPFKLSSGDSGSVYFVTRNDDGGIMPCNPSSSPCFNGNNLNLCWGEQGSDTAVLVSIIYRNNSGNFGVSSVGYDPVSTRRSGGSDPNNFEAAGGSCSIGAGSESRSYAYRAQVDFNSLNITGQPILMRVSMLYNNNPQEFGVSTLSDLPVQGRRVNSQGSAGEATRRINAYLLNPEVPFIFDAAIYSNRDISK